MVMLIHPTVWRARWYPSLFKTGKRLVRGALRRIFVTNSAYWFERDLRPDGPPAAPPVGVRVSWQSFNTTVSWIRKQGSPWMLSARELATARAARHEYPALYRGGEIIGFLKVGQDRVYINDYRRVIALPERAAFIYDTWVQPEHRSRGVGTAAIENVASRLKARGFISVGCHIPPWNTASIRAYERSGFRRIRYVRHFRVLGLPFYISRSCRRESPEELNNRLRERVSIHGR